MIKNHFKQHLLVLFFFLFTSSVVLAENKTPVVKIGVFQLAPLVYIDDNGSPQGIFVDVIEEIAGKENLKVEYVIGSWNGGLEGTKKGQLDLMTAVMHLKRRESFLDFPKESVFNIWGQLYTHKDTDISGVFDMEGKTVGVLKGGANGENFIALMDKFGIKCNIVHFDSQEDTADAISKKSVDAGVFTNVHGYHFQLSHHLKQTQIVFDPSYLKFATAEGKNQQLLKTIDVYLSKWKADRNSIYYTIIDKHLGMSERKGIPDWVWWIIIAGAGVLVLTMLGTFILLVFNRKMRIKVKDKTHDIDKRMKELKCLYTISKFLEDIDTPFQEIFENVVNVIPPAWQYPEITCSRIVFNNQEYRSDNFKATTWKQSISILVHGKKKGVVETYYLQNMSKIDEGPFLKEERDLINEIADRIGRFIERNQADEKRYKAEEKLQESEEKYKTLFERESDAIFIYDPDTTNILDANKATLKMYGYNHDELIGMSCLNFSAEAEKSVSIIAKNLEVDNINIPIRFHCKKDGTTFPVEINNYAITLKGKKVMYAVCKDISMQTQAEDAKKKLEIQLQQSQKMESIGTLAGGIAHDFNNILSSIIGFSELALDGVDKGTELEDDLQEVRKAGMRAKDLVKQILTFARQSDEEVKPIQVNIIVKEVLKFIKSSIPTTIQINDDLNSDSLIMGSPTQVYQVLMNLCTNAAHAMEENGGILEVSVNDTTINKMAIPDLKSGEYMEIKVTDTGMGISPQHIHTIFEPYFTTKPVGEGTGMGLAVVHGIVKNYGGNIAVDSTIGKGTCFTIYLPITKKRKAHTPSVKEDLPLGTENILFVDDEASIAKMMSKALGQLGYCVTTRTSSVEALELFRSKPHAFDLVVTDMTMPNMTGDNLAGELMKIRPGISVILCTGYSKKISEESAADIGIKALVYKPVVKADLAKTVRKVLDEANSSE